MADRKYFVGNPVIAAREIITASHAIASEYPFDQFQSLFTNHPHESLKMKDFNDFQPYLS
jgi:hypothetical protein